MTQPTDASEPIDPLAALERHAAAAQLRVMLGSAGKLVGCAALALLALLLNAAFAGYAAVHYLPRGATYTVAGALLLALAVLGYRASRDLVTLPDRVIECDRDHDHSAPDFAEVNRRILAGPDQTWPARLWRLTRLTAWTSVAAFGGWALLSWAGAALAVAAGADRTWFAFRGVRRRWLREIGPMYRMISTRGFDDTPEI